MEITVDLKLTQTLVSRKHYNIFQFYFPEEIQNWFCYNWLNDVYINHRFILYDYKCGNKIKALPGKSRYTIITCEGICTNLIKRDGIKLDINSWDLRRED